MKNSFIVENLKCGGCATSIKSALMTLPGISEVTVDTESNTVSVDSEGEDIRTLISETLNGLGYPEAGHNSLLLQGKSFVSCAVGKVKNMTQTTPV